MGHVAEQLPEEVEIGALRIDPQEGLEVTRKDNLRTVRNSRVDSEPPRWEISFPVADVETGDTSIFVAVRDMWKNTERGLHTFDFRCFVDGLIHRVRFASEMPTRAPAGHLRHIETMTIEEDE